MFVSYFGGSGATGFDGAIGFAYIPATASNTWVTGRPYNRTVASGPLASIISNGSFCDSCPYFPLSNSITGTSGVAIETAVWVTNDDIYFFGIATNKVIRRASVSGTSLSYITENTGVSTSSLANIQEVVASPDGNTILQAYGDGTTTGGVKQLDRASNVDASGNRIEFSDLGDISIGTACPWRCYFSRWFIGNCK